MVVSMSEKEFSRLGVLMDAQAGRLRIDDAAPWRESSYRNHLKSYKKRGAFAAMSPTRPLRMDNCSQRPLSEIERNGFLIHHRPPS